jgi:hypothetical protein
MRATEKCFHGEIDFNEKNLLHLKSLFIKGGKSISNFMRTLFIIFCTEILFFATNFESHTHSSDSNPRSSVPEANAILHTAPRHQDSLFKIIN